MIVELTREQLHLLSDIEHESITGLGALVQLIDSVQQRFDRVIELWYADSLASIQQAFSNEAKPMRPLPGDDYQLYAVDVDSANLTLYVLVPMSHRAHLAVSA